MTTDHLPERLTLLVAEFDRSGIGELSVKGLDFELRLRAGRKPDYSERRTAASSTDELQ